MGGWSWETRRQSLFLIEPEIRRLRSKYFLTGKRINPEVVACAVDEDGVGYLADGQGPQGTRGPAQKGEGAGPISFWETQDSLLILVVDTVKPCRGLVDGALCNWFLFTHPHQGIPLHRSDMTSGVVDWAPSLLLGSLPSATCLV